MKYQILIALIASASAIQLSGEPENSVQSKQYDEYGPTEKVQNLMPRRYERSANSNYVDGVRVSRTTWYAQLGDDIRVTPYTSADQPSVSNAEVLNNVADLDIPKPVRNIDTQSFTQDLKALQADLAENERELQKEESDKRFRSKFGVGSGEI